MPANSLWTRGINDPPPGSLTAWLAGCTCPREANHHGNGASRLPGTPIPLFYFNPQCPLHHDMEQRLEEVVGREWIERWYACQQKMERPDPPPATATTGGQAPITGWQKAWRWLRARLPRRDAGNEN